MNSPLKVLTIVGTRPELIRLSRVIALLDEYVDHRLVHTGQNYDFELNEIFFEELGIRKPDHFLGAGGGTLGELLGKILIETERVLQEERPDAVLILGDTNSSISAIIAKRRNIPVYHMEAGNRCFDGNVPEELNRRIIDGIADFNLVYTEHARRHLLSEGLPHRRIYLTGSPMREVLDYFRNKIDASDVLREMALRKRRYLLASIHREESVDSSSTLQSLLQTLQFLGDKYDVPVVLSTHPRTRKRIDELPREAENSRIVFSKPFGFFDYNWLQINALCVLSDSGTISEESAILGFRAVTVRNAMERPEAMDTGSIVLTGIDPDTIAHAVDLVIEQGRSKSAIVCPDDYKVTNVSQRVVNLIVGTARLSNRWEGIYPHDHRWRQ